MSTTKKAPNKKTITDAIVKVGQGISTAHEYVSPLNEEARCDLISAEEALIDLTEYLSGQGLVSGDFPVDALEQRRTVLEDERRKYQEGEVDEDPLMGLAGLLGDFDDQSFNDEDFGV